MSHFRIGLVLTAFMLLPLSSAEAADGFPENTIPTMAMRIKGPGASFITDFPIQLLCELSWLNFDAVNFAGRASKDNVRDLMSLCDSAGVHYSLCASEIMQYQKEWGDPEYRYWFRYEDASLTSDSCFARCNAEFDSILQFMSAESLYYMDDSLSIRSTIDTLASYTDNHPYLWFYEVYDEANSQQRRHSVETPEPWDDYVPNIYTQARDSVTGYLTLEEVESSGVFSIQKYYAENNEDNPVPFTMNFAMLHTIDSSEYAGLSGDINYGTFEDQARCVRSMMEAEYQPPPDSNGIVPNTTLDNSPDFIMFDYYPFRYVNPQTTSSQLCDTNWLFLVEHFEEGIDSTVIPSHEYDCPVYYFPQTFGVAGGPAMWNSTYDTLTYNSYVHRKPSPREFRMLCNLALLHQAKGIFPYNLCSYVGGDDNRIMSSLLDLHNIPFDAPYEEWRYTGRWSADTLEYIRPDSIPPWRSGYDPLFSMSSPPDTSGDGQRAGENWYDWHFSPYADLYNNLYDILAEVKILGPELHDLWWCAGDTSRTADMSYGEIPVPANLITPEIRVFEDEARESCYLFYVDRYCISNGNPYQITFDPEELPQHAASSPWLLDHSRRFIMEGSWNDTDSVYVFLDTLDAGEGRLVQLVDPREGLPADVRITSPDIRLIDDDGETHERLEATVGDTVTILASFYNMGTDGITDLPVLLYDNTAQDTIALDTLDFSGLPWWPPSSCGTSDRDTAVFEWIPDPADIGAHRMTVSASTWAGEPDRTDNSVDLTFLVHPRDYATEVRGNSWDMDEDSTTSWFTSDIDSVALNWDTTETGWTDSVGGMFEGVIEYDSTISPCFRGDISLAIPAGSTIDSERYHMLSLGIVCNNPNRTSGSAVDMKIGWVDTDDGWHGWSGFLAGSNFAVGNGWDGYAAVGPVDLNAITGLEWGDEEVKELWLSLRCNDVIIDPPQPIDVRIGWVRLEEAAP